MVGKDIPRGKDVSPGMDDGWGEDVSLGIDSGQKEGGLGENTFPRKKMCPFGMDNG
jgi:hypothetical protein